jgi:hypothetical protein
MDHNDRHKDFKYILKLARELLFFNLNFHHSTTRAPSVAVARTTYQKWTKRMFMSTFCAKIIVELSPGYPNPRTFQIRARYGPVVHSTATGGAATKLPGLSKFFFALLAV